MLLGELSSRAQNAIIPNKMIGDAGAPRIPRVPPKIRKGSSPLGIAAIWEKQGVNMKATNNPTHTTIQAA